MIILKRLFVTILTLSRFIPSLAQEINANLCNSLIEKYVFMHNLDLSWANSSYYQFNSEGTILDTSNIYCEPFDSARVLRTIYNQRVQLTQQGYFEGQDWYKINLHDSIQTIGYLKGESVGFVSKKSNPCNNNYCNLLYYSLQPHRIETFAVNRRIILKSFNPVDSTFNQFFLTDEMRFPKVEIQYLKQVEKSDFYYVQVEKPSEIGSLGTYYLILVDRVNGNISLLHREDYHGLEDGYRQVNIFYSDAAYSWKNLVSFGAPMNTYPPDTTVKRPESLYSNHLVYITTETSDITIDKNGEYVIDENGMIKLHVIGNSSQWYDIIEGKLVPIMVNSK